MSDNEQETKTRDAYNSVFNVLSIMYIGGASDHTKAVFKEGCIDAFRKPLMGAMKSGIAPYVGKFPEALADYQVACREDDKKRNSIGFHLAQTYTTELVDLWAIAPLGRDDKRARVGSAELLPIFIEEAAKAGFPFAAPNQEMIDALRTIAANPTQHKEREGPISRQTFLFTEYATRYAIRTHVEAFALPAAEQQAYLSTHAEELARYYENEQSRHGVGVGTQRRDATEEPGF